MVRNCQRGSLSSLYGYTFCKNKIFVAVKVFVADTVPWNSLCRSRRSYLPMIICLFIHHATFLFPSFSTKDAGITRSPRNCFRTFENIIEKQIVCWTHTWSSWDVPWILFVVFCNCSVWKATTENGWNEQIGESYCYQYLNVLLFSQTHMYSNITCIPHFTFFATGNSSNFIARLMIHNSSFCFPASKQFQAICNNSTCFSLMFRGLIFD